MAIVLKGTSVKDLTKLSLNLIGKMDSKDRRAIINKMISAANKRIKRLKLKFGQDHPLLKDVLPEEGKFSMKRVPKNDPYAEKKMYQRVKNFLRGIKTTLKGFKKYDEGRAGDRARLAEELKVPAGEYEEYKAELDRLLSALKLIDLQKYYDLVDMTTIWRGKGYNWKEILDFAKKQIDDWGLTQDVNDLKDLFTFDGEL